MKINLVQVRQDVLRDPRKNNKWNDAGLKELSCYRHSCCSSTHVTPMRHGNVLYSAARQDPETNQWNCYAVTLAGMCRAAY